MKDKLANRQDVSAEKLTLVPAKLDLKGQKPQYALYFLLLLLIGLSAYWRTLSSGFLLDDFIHFDYVYRALQGDWADFLHNLTGNWAGSEIMKSYRPVVSFSLLADCWFWRDNAWGYHLTNALLHIFAAVFMGLIVLEITGLYGNRLGAAGAIWTALLFSLYPLHPEATVWIIGRVELLCSLFYYATIFLYIRFRSFRAKHCLYWSLVCFVLALASKEMAATLPCVILLIEILLPGPSTPVTVKARSSQKLRRLSAVLLFFAILGLFTTWRAFCLSSTISGYGENTLDAPVFANFADLPSVYKIFFPHNEEASFVKIYAPIIDTLLAASYAGIMVVLLIKIFNRALAWRPLLFLFCWLLLAVLPAFQIWHIGSNLVGSRLFYLSSGPFCALLVLSALPACEALAKNSRAVVLLISLCSLSLLASCYALYLTANTSCWGEAGREMRKSAGDLSLFPQAATVLVK